MLDGIFKRNGFSAYARATEIMTTQSETDFEWSVKLIGDQHFIVGIASQLNPGEYSYIRDYDPNAILYLSNDHSPVIQVESTDVIFGDQSLPEQKTGDVIHFRFEPRRKKLVIDLVRIGNFYFQLTL